MLDCIVAACACCIGERGFPIGNRDIVHIRGGSIRVIHFIGIRDDQYRRAVLIWGVPDFYHHWHDRRVYGDVGDGDVLVFGDKADPEYVKEFSWQDHELY